MAKRIVWSKVARLDFKEILDFYIRRHGNSIYARKLNESLKKTLQLLSEYEYLGVMSDYEEVRVLIKGDLKVYYKLFPEYIFLITVWHAKQNPDLLERKMPQ